MRPDTILGWSIEDFRRSHVIGATDIVVGTRSAATVTVSYSLCGTRGHGGSVATEPRTTPCSRCLSAAFKLAKQDELPDMKLPPRYRR